MNAQVLTRLFSSVWSSGASSNDCADTLITEPDDSSCVIEGRNAGDSEGASAGLQTGNGVPLAGEFGSEETIFTIPSKKGWPFAGLLVRSRSTVCTRSPSV